MIHQKTFTEQPPHTVPRDTRAAAHDESKQTAVTLRVLCMQSLIVRPGTADDVATRLGETVLAIRPRITELAKNGLIEDSGQRRPNASGRAAKVWRYVKQ